MPTSPKIPKEAILQAALQILIRDGFHMVNIKNIARELNCSTQPISWHFGNMDNLKAELGRYAYMYADDKTTPTSENAVDAFSQVGNALADIAFDQPNLYRFLFLDGSCGYCIGGIDALTELKDNCEMIQLLAEQNGLSVEAAGRFLENTIIYTMGLLSLCVSGVLSCNKQEVQEKMQSMSNQLLAMEKKES